MNCEQIQPNLLEYSLQPSSCPDCEAIGAHLANCEACRGVLKQEQEMASRLSAMTPIKPATDMWSVVREKTRGRLPVWAGFAYGVVWTNTRRLAAAGAAICVLTAAFVIGAGQYAEDRQQTAVSYLVEMQRPAQAHVTWTDDPLGDTSESASDALGEGS